MTEPEGFTRLRAALHDVLDREFGTERKAEYLVTLSNDLADTCYRALLATPEAAPREPDAWVPRHKESGKVAWTYARATDNDVAHELFMASMIGYEIIPLYRAPALSVTEEAVAIACALADWQTRNILPPNNEVWMLCERARRLTAAFTANAGGGR